MVIPTSARVQINVDLVNSCNDCRCCFGNRCFPKYHFKHQNKLEAKTIEVVEEILVQSSSSSISSSASSSLPSK